MPIFVNCKKGVRSKVETYIHLLIRIEKYEMYRQYPWNKHLHTNVNKTEN